MSRKEQYADEIIAKLEENKNGYWVDWIDKRSKDAVIEVCQNVVEDWCGRATDHVKTTNEDTAYRHWNNHQVACLLADMFGDSCACNYNGIDEWLPELCDFKDTCCPKPVGVACWEQFLKHTKSRYCECGYEVR